MVDCRRQQAGVTSEADGCTGDKNFKQAWFTGKLVDENYTTIVDLTAGEITKDVKAKLTALVSEFRDVFALTESELAATIQVYHHIDTEGMPPVKLPSHRVSPAKQPLVQHEVQDMLRRGIIQHSQNATARSL